MATSVKGKTRQRRPAHLRVLLVGTACTALMRLPACAPRQSALDVNDLLCFIKIAFLPGQGDHKENGSEMGKGSAVPDKQNDAGTRASASVDDGSQEKAEQDVNENGERQSKGLADLMQKGRMQPPHVDGQPGS